ncbi:MAG: RloB domain-containing protein, partial [Sphaerochaetaceae bacterium]
RLFITNPCFEFFLLLHKTDCAHYSADDIRRNCKQGEHTYIERKLREFVPKYKKSNLRFCDFEEDIVTALRNCLQYAQSLDKIRDRVGTNLNVLISELLIP